MCIRDRTWVKAHVGIEGNEEADQAAKEGANSTNIETYLPKPWCETLKLVEDLINEEWNFRWVDDTQYVHSKFFFPQLDPQKSKKILDYSRCYLQTLVRALTGHNFLAKHQNRIGNPVAPECRLCEEDKETFIHLLTTCPRLKKPREEIFLDRDPSTHWEPHQIMRFIKTTVVDDLLAEKEGYLELPIIDVFHNYSSSADSD